MGSIAFATQPSVRGKGASSALMECVCRRARQLSSTLCRNSYDNKMCLQILWPSPLCPGKTDSAIMPKGRALINICSSFLVPFGTWLAGWLPDSSKLCHLSLRSRCQEMKLFLHPLHDVRVLLGYLCTPHKGREVCVSKLDPLLHIFKHLFYSCFSLSKKEQQDLHG